MAKPKIVDFNESHLRWWNELNAKIKARERIVKQQFKLMADEILNDALRVIRSELEVQFGCVDLEKDYVFEPENHRFAHRDIKEMADEIKGLNIRSWRPPEADEFSGCPGGIKMED